MSDEETPPKDAGAPLKDGATRAIKGSNSSRPRSAILDPVRKMVSKDRKRFKEGKYDLDLSYITQQIVGKFFKTPDMI